jgi:hypothetical protein
MLLRLFVIPFIIYLTSPSEVLAADSLQHKTKSWVLTPRFNTLNMAPVSGNIVNNNINLDVSLIFTKHRFMWTVVNGVDLEDVNSEMNYFLTNIRYKISITKYFGFSPFLAFYSEHAHRLIDPISDFNSGIIFYFQHKALTLEAFFLAVRLTHPTIEKDLINRFEIRYKSNSFLISGFVFQNTEYFDSRKRLAVGFKIAMPELNLSERIKARTEVTGSFRVSENPETKNLNGIFLSLAFPVRSQN